MRAAPLEGQVPVMGAKRAYVLREISSQPLVWPEGASPERESPTLVGTRACTNSTTTSQCSHSPCAGTQSTRTVPNTSRTLPLTPIFRTPRRLRAQKVKYVVEVSLTEWLSPFTLRDTSLGLGGTTSALWFRVDRGLRRSLAQTSMHLASGRAME